MKKKVLVLCFTVLLGFTLTGCSIVSDEDFSALQTEVDGMITYDDQTIKDQISVIDSALSSLEADSYDDTDVLADITALQSSIATLLTSVTALQNDLQAVNGEVDALEIPDVTALLSTIATLESRIASLEANTSTGSTPNYDYIYDVDGEYITLKALLELLVQKYLNAPLTEDFGGSEGYKSYFGSSVELNAELSGELDLTDQYAKFILLVEELRDYEFYYYGKSEIRMYLWNQFGENNFRYFNFNIPTNIFQQDEMHISVHEIFTYQFDIRGNNDGSFVESEVQAAYDALVASGLYDGNVLDIQ